MTTTKLKPHTITQTRKKLKCRSPATAGSATRNAHLKLSQGSKVEVKSDEEGFRGAWYGATVIGEVSPSKKNLGKGPFMVVYDTLLAGEEDPLEFLKEPVDLSSIRPAPPTDDEDRLVFGLYDVVDAFLRDGWWTGVVTRVGGEKGGAKFTVFFHSPPEEIEFDRSELRLHREWIDGKWNLWKSGAANQKMDGSLFSIGREVEVSLDEGEVGEVWFLAVLLGELVNGDFVIECLKSGSNSIDEARRRRETVDALHIRPCPPSIEYKKFTLSRKADVFCGFGWSRGLITNILENGKYIIVLDRTKEEKEVSLGYIRPCMDWTNGNWVITSEQIVEPESGTSSKKRKRGRQPKPMIELAGFADSGEKSVETSASEATTKGNTKKEAVHSPETGALQSSKVLQMYSSKRELQRSMSGTEPLAPDPEDSLRGKASNVTEAVVAETPSREYSDNLPLLKLFGTKKPRSTGSKSGISVENAMKPCSTTSARCEENATKSPEIAFENLNASETNENLPFEKCSPIWTTLQRMDILKKMPQKPHFQPLLDVNEYIREGLAIGRMFTFASIAEAASKLQIGDPKDAILSISEALSDLEAHGFNVDPISHRLDELLMKKEETGKLQEELESLHKKIDERCLERNKIDEEVQELKAKLSLAESAAGKIDEEIAGMELEVDVINREVQSSQNDFERLAAAPW